MVDRDEPHPGYRFIYDGEVVRMSEDEYREFVASGKLDDRFDFVTDEE